MYNIVALQSVTARDGAISRLSAYTHYSAPSNVYPLRAGRYMYIGTANL